LKELTADCYLLIAAKQYSQHQIFKFSQWLRSAAG